MARQKWLLPLKLSLKLIKVWYKVSGWHGPIAHCAKYTTVSREIVWPKWICQVYTGFSLIRPWALIFLVPLPRATNGDRAIIVSRRQLEIFSNISEHQILRDVRRSPHALPTWMHVMHPPHAATYAHPGKTTPRLHYLHDFDKKREICILLEWWHGHQWCACVRACVRVKPGCSTVTHQYILEILNPNNIPACRMHVHHLR